MKLVLIITTFFFIGRANSQSNIQYFLNNQPLDSIKVEYIQIVGSPSAFSSKLDIVIDYGQWTGWKQDYKLTDNFGKNVELTSMIDALNFMYKNGFELVNTFASSPTKSTYYHYILKRKNK
jgi:hypothetical protein